MPLAKTRDDGGRGLRRAAVLANADWCVTTPLLPALAAGLGTGPGTVTLSVGLHSLGHACALPLWGRLVDRYGPQAAVRAGLLLAAVASAGSALATGAGPWLVLRVLAGAGFAALTPAIAARHAAVADPGARQRRFAGLTTATSVSAVLTPLLAGLAVAHGSWRLLFGALAVGAGLTVAGLRRGAPPGPRPTGRRPVPSGRRLVLGLGLLEGTALVAPPMLLVPALGEGAGRAGPVVVTAYALGVLAGSLTVRRHGRRWPAGRLLAVGGLACVSAAAVAWSGRSAVPAVLAAVLYGCAWSYLHTTLQTWLPGAGPAGSEGGTASLFATSGMLAGALTVTAAAPLLDHGWAGWLFGAEAVLGAALVPAARSLTRPPVATREFPVEFPEKNPDRKFAAVARVGILFSQSPGNVVDPGPPEHLTSIPGRNPWVAV